jgi:hypothetical protein
MVPSNPPVFPHTIQFVIAAAAVLQLMPPAVPRFQELPFPNTVQLVITGEADPQCIPPPVSPPFPAITQFMMRGDVVPHSIPPVPNPPELSMIKQLEIKGDSPKPLQVMPPPPPIFTVLEIILQFRIIGEAFWIVIPPSLPFVIVNPSRMALALMATQGNGATFPSFVPSIVVI